MKKEDIEFLRELQHELNTQEHDCQAAPRFWGIVEYEEFLSNSDGYDNEYIYSCQDAEKWTHKEAVEWIDDVVHESFPEFQEEWNTEVKDKFEADELCEWANENLGMDLEMLYTCDYKNCPTRQVVSLPREPPNSIWHRMATTTITARPTQ